MSTYVPCVPCVSHVSHAFTVGAVKHGTYMSTEAHMMQAAAASAVSGQEDGPDGDQPARKRSRGRPLGSKTKV